MDRPGLARGLVAALAFPFVVDSLGRLTYAWSRGFWVIPILYLIPLFLTLTADGHGQAPPRLC